jgi:predicted nuclease with RNAse H fold
MRTLGIDLSTSPAGTWGCLIEWHPERARLIGLCDRLDDERLVAAILGRDEVWGDAGGPIDVTGIDCPLGWPEPFVAAVTAHSQGGDWPGRGHADAAEYRRSLCLRETDRALGIETGSNPLSVSADRLGATAMRCALLQDALIGEHGLRIDRTGCAGPIVEVYPRSALWRWGLPSTGYKLSKGASARPGIVRRLHEDSDVAIEPEDLARMVKRDDALDAFVASLVARAARTGLTEPPAGDAASRAASEGWIHVPRAGSLRQLVGAR